MKTLIAKLAAATVALTAARAARACDPPKPSARPGLRLTLAAAAPVASPFPVLRVHEERWDRRDDDDRRDRRWEEGRGERWRHEARQAEALDRLRAEHDRLDDARADFYARPHRREERRRFEAWYASARADLDLRWNRLTFMAAR
jgi:hypothetical protein